MRSFITNFTTTSEHENILDTSSNVKARLRELLGVNDTELARMLANREVKAKCTIFFNADNKVSINNGSWNDLIEDVVYTTGDYVHLGSIRIEEEASAKIMVTLD